MGNGYDNEYVERDKGETDTIDRYRGRERERMRARARPVYAYVEIAYELPTSPFDLSLARHRAPTISN